MQLDTPLASNRASNSDLPDLAELPIVARRIHLPFSPEWVEFFKDFFKTLACSVQHVETRLNRQQLVVQNLASSLNNEEANLELEYRTQVEAILATSFDPIHEPIARRVALLMALQKFSDKEAECATNVPLIDPESLKENLLKPSLWRFNKERHLQYLAEGSNEDLSRLKQLTNRELRERYLATCFKRFLDRENGNEVASHPFVAITSWAESAFDWLQMRMKEESETSNLFPIKCSYFLTALIFQMEAMKWRYFYDTEGKLLVPPLEEKKIIEEYKRLQSRLEKLPLQLEKRESLPTSSSAAPPSSSTFFRSIFSFGKKREKSITLTTEPAPHKNESSSNSHSNISAEKDPNKAWEQFHEDLELLLYYLNSLKSAMSEKDPINTSGNHDRMVRVRSGSLLTPRRMSLSLTPEVAGKAIFPESSPIAIGNSGAAAGATTLASTPSRSPRPTVSTGREEKELINTSSRSPRPTGSREDLSRFRSISMLSRNSSTVASAVGVTDSSRPRQTSLLGTSPSSSNPSLPQKESPRQSARLTNELLSIIDTTFLMLQHVNGRLNDQMKQATPIPLKSLSSAMILYDAEDSQAQKYRQLAAALEQIISYLNELTEIWLESFDERRPILFLEEYYHYLSYEAEAANRSFWAAFQEEQKAWRDKYPIPTEKQLNEWAIFAIEFQKNWRRKREHYFGNVTLFHLKNTLERPVVDTCLAEKINALIPDQLKPQFNSEEEFKTFMKGQSLLAIARFNVSTENTTTTHFVKELMKYFSDRQAAIAKNISFLHKPHENSFSSPSDQTTRVAELQEAVSDTQRELLLGMGLCDLYAHLQEYKKLSEQFGSFKEQPISATASPTLEEMSSKLKEIANLIAQIDLAKLAKSLNEQEERWQQFCLTEAGNREQRASLNRARQSLQTSVNRICRVANQVLSSIYARNTFTKRLLEDTTLAAIKPSDSGSLRWGWSLTLNRTSDRSQSPAPAASAASHSRRPSAGNANSVRGATSTTLTDAALNRTSDRGTYTPLAASPASLVLRSSASRGNPSPMRGATSATVADTGGAPRTGSPSQPSPLIPSAPNSLKDSFTSASAINRALTPTPEQEAEQRQRGIIENFAKIAQLLPKLADFLFRFPIPKR
jgi:hypothetical protein